MQFAWPIPVRHFGCLVHAIWCIVQLRGVLKQVAHLCTYLMCTETSGHTKMLHREVNDEHNVSQEWLLWLPML